MDTPPYIEAAIAPATAISYTWNLDVSRAIKHPLDTEHPRLAQAFGLTRLRPAFGMLLATAEWVVWRFRGIVPLDDAVHRLEAGYAAVIDPRYAVLPQPSEPFPDQLQDAHGPLKLARMLVASGYEYFAAQDTAVYACAFSTALLARHVVPQRGLFEKWLAQTLRKCSEHFPRDETPPEEQAAVPRSFFDPAHPWDPAEAQSELRSFLQALSPGENPYLRSPADLRAAGLAAPYQI